MARRERVIVRRPARGRRPSWIPTVLVIALLVVGGILLWMLFSGDDETPVEGAALIAGALAARRFGITPHREEDLPRAA
jgi:hypothetical protein